MKHIKQLLVFFLALTVFYSCTEDETSYALQNVSAPTNVNAIFEIAQDDTGTVNVTPTAEGATNFQVFFGDSESETGTEVTPGENITHTYGEGVFTLRVVGVGATGLTSELNREITISFTAPSNLMVATVAQSNPLEIVVTPTADDATVYDIYFGDVTGEEPTTIMYGETASHIYTIAGDYTVRVVAKGAGAATVEFSEVITIENSNLISSSDFIGTWKMASEAGSLGVGPSVGDTSWFAIDDQGIIDRACYFDDSYVFSTDGSFANILGTATWIEGWQGGSDACGTPVAPHDGSASATYAYDATAGTITITGAGSYIGIPKANNDGELPNVAVPNAIS
uniref:PKD domain-containing protein n=1 Tax=Maribacter sp. TaxID=1897614 RepID=UPI00344BD4C5